MITTWCEDLSVNTVRVAAPVQRQQCRQQQVWSDSHGLLVNALHLSQMPKRGPAFTRKTLSWVTQVKSWLKKLRWPNTPAPLQSWDSWVQLFLPVRTQFCSVKASSHAPQHSKHRSDSGNTSDMRYFFYYLFSILALHCGLLLSDISCTNRANRCDFNRLKSRCLSRKN